MRIQDFCVAAEPPCSLHGYDARALGRALATDFTGSTSKVQQQYGSEVDINTIVRRFGATGDFPAHMGAGVYGDFTGLGGLVDITDVRSLLERAEESFMRLRPEVRERYGNDAGRLIARAAELSEDEFRREVFGEELVSVPTSAPLVVPVPPSEGSGFAAT